MTTKRMVALCDILGFKDLVRRTPVDLLVATYLKQFRRVIGHCIERQNFPSEPPSLGVLREQKRVGIGWFSDTVLLYALDDSDVACENVIETVGWFLFETIFGTYTKLRVGLAYGEFYDDPENEIYVGSALVEAYELEKAQGWFGGALTESAAERAQSADLNMLEGWLHLYEIPIKADARALVKSDVAVNWTSGIHDSPTEIPWSSEAIEPSPEEKVTFPDVHAKWLNARTFHRDVCTYCNGGERSW